VPTRSWPTPALHSAAFIAVFPSRSRRRREKLEPDRQHHRRKIYTMFQRKPADQPKPEGERANPSPGVIGGAGLVGGLAGIAISGPLVGAAVGGAAAVATLLKNEVGRLCGGLLNPIIK